MDKEKSLCIDNFYCISSLLDDNLKYVAVFIKQYSGTKRSLRDINRICVKAQYCKINEEIEEVLELSTSIYKAFLDQMVFLDECKDTNDCGIIKE